MTTFTPLSLARALALLPAHDAEARFAHLFEQMPAAFLVEQEGRAVRAVNHRAAALTHWTRGELTARSLERLLAPPRLAEALDAFDRLEPGQLRTVQNVGLRRRSGGRLVVDLRLSAFLEAGQTMVAVSAEAADERLALERQSQQQTQILSAADRLVALCAAPSADSMAPAVSLVRDMLAAPVTGYFQLQPNSPGLRLVFADGVSPNFPQVVGPEDLPDLTHPVLWHAAQRADVRLLQAARAAGWTQFISHPVGDATATVGSVFVAYTAEARPPAQAPTLLALAARLLGHLVSLASQSRHTSNAHDLALHLSSRLAAISSQIEEGILVADPDGVIEEANRIAAEMLGFRPEDMIGLPLAEVLFADEPLAALFRNNTRRPPAESIEGQLHRRSGEPFPVEVRLLPLTDCSCVLILRDLSEIKANEIQREKQGHLAFVGLSTQTFAHEVRAPLNVLSLGAQFLAKRLPADDEELQGHLNTMLRECQNLSELMEDMLNWAKPVAPHLVPTDMRAVLERLLVRWTGKMRRHNVHFQIAPTADIPPILADRPLLERAFVTLFENALQAMPAGGCLSVTLRALDRAPHGQAVEVRVVDSGPGMPDDVRQRAFEPHFTTKANGTGLGLAICKRLVTIHHGGIDCESYPGTGTIFTLTFPAAAAPGASQDKEPE